MRQRQPLCDSWLYWDAERLDAYPHSDNAGPGAGQPARGPRSDSAQRPLRLRLFEDLLLYLAGVASALIGVGLAILIGSFISAYDMLGNVQRAGYETIVEYPEMNPDPPAMLAGAAAVAGVDLRSTTRPVPAPQTARSPTAAGSPTPVFVTRP